MKSAELLAEANLLLGWKPDYSLQMPASRFFAVLNEARKFKHKMDFWYFYNLCYVSKISNADPKWCEKTIGHFYEPLRKTNPDPVPNDVAAGVIKAWMGGMGG